MSDNVAMGLLFAIVVCGVVIVYILLQIEHTLVRIRDYMENPELWRDLKRKIYTAPYSEVVLPESAEEAQEVEDRTRAGRKPSPAELEAMTVINRSVDEL